MNSFLIAGAFSGIVGLLVFLTIHHFWMRPIWFILLPGALIAALGGLAIGWAYAEIKVGLPPRPWTALAVMALVGVILLPSIVLAELRPALFDIETGKLIDGKSTEAAIRFVLELLLTATVVGALAGWRLGGAGWAAFATTLAGFVFALGPGHNIPLLCGTPGVGKGIALLVAVVVVAAVVLVEGQAWVRLTAVLNGN